MVLDSDLPPEEAKQSDVGTVLEVVKAEKAYETRIEGLSSDSQTVISGPPAKEGNAYPKKHQLLLAKPWSYSKCWSSLTLMNHLKRQRW